MILYSDLRQRYRFAWICDKETNEAIALIGIYELYVEHCTEDGSIIYPLPLFLKKFPEYFKMEDNDAKGENEC